jgi:hypothetical protein
MDSPLTQQSRPETFEPKVVGLYRDLFRVSSHPDWPIDSVTDDLQEVDEEEKDDSFWNTLFILKPDVAALGDILDNTDADFLLHLQVTSKYEV